MNRIRPKKLQLEQEVKIYRVLLVLIICLVMGEGIFLYRTSYNDSSEINYEESEVMLENKYDFKESS